MSYSEIVFGKKAKEKVFAGIEMAYKAVSPTLGPKGKNSVFRQGGVPIITNDGVSILRQLNPKDEFEAIGVDLVRQASERTNFEAGDGTTTAAILAYHLIKDSDSDINPISLRKELDEAKEELLKELENKSKKIESKTDLKKIAFVSLEDNKLADLVVDAVSKSGDTGKVIVEESVETTIKKEEIEGMELDCGLASGYMVTDTSKMETVMDNTPVLITDKRFTLTREIIPFLDEVLKNGHKQVLIFAKEVEGEALQTLIVNKIQGKFTSIVVKHNLSTDELEDVASLLGGNLVSDLKGQQPIVFSQVGFASKAVVSKNKTILVGSRTDAVKEMNHQERVQSLVTAVKKEKNSEELKDRLARLTSSIVFLKVGAPSEAERTYLKLKIDDAVLACIAAREEGFVKGGGLTIRKAGNAVFDRLKTRGARILNLACNAPYIQIQKSSGLSETEYDESLKDIIDPTKVEKCAIKNAVSLAAIYSTIDNVIIEKFEKTNV